MKLHLVLYGCLALFTWAVVPSAAQANEPSAFSLSWKDNLLAVHREGLPGGDVTVWYLEAFCRPGSTDRDWSLTTIDHKTELLKDEGGQVLKLRSRLADGVEVEHVIRAVEDGVAFDLVAKNPTDKPSEAHWAQPCIRVGPFTGFPPQKSAEEHYLPKCFVFVDGQLSKMPLTSWATKARYVPGQVWCPKHVNRNDVNPRPLSEVVPSNGLIGCFSSDDKWILASAWEPYQELFQGVITCVHSDFRIGGLAAGEEKAIHGRLYIIPADPADLLARYTRDFPEQTGE